MITKDIWYDKTKFGKIYDCYKCWIRNNSDGSNEKLIIKRYIISKSIEYDVEYFKFNKDNKNFINTVNKITYANISLNKIINILNEKYDLNNTKSDLINNIHDLYDE